MNAIAEKKRQSKSQRVRYVLVSALLVSVAVMAGTILVAIMVNDFEELNARWLFTGMAGFVYSALLLTTQVSADNKPSIKALTIFTTCVLCLSGIVWMIFIWTVDDRPNTELFAKFSLTLTIVAIVLAVSCQLLALETRFAWLRYGIFATIALMGFEGLFLTCILYEVVDYVIAWLTVPIGIVTLLALIVLPLIVKLLEKGVVKAAETIPMRLSLNMTCPLCESQQVFNNGSSRCRNCKKLILIEIEEPRCECGYLLYQLASQICPECGRPVPEDQRWLGTQSGVEA